MNYRLENNPEELAKAHIAAGKHPKGRAFLVINSSGAVTYVGTEMRTTRVQTRVKATATRVKERG